MVSSFETNNYTAQVVIVSCPFLCSQNKPGLLFFWTLLWKCITLIPCCLALRQLRGWMYWSHLTTSTTLTIAYCKIRRWLSSVFKTSPHNPLHWCCNLLFVFNQTFLNYLHDSKHQVSHNFSLHSKSSVHITHLLSIMFSSEMLDSHSANPDSEYFRIIVKQFMDVGVVFEIHM